MDLVFGSAKPYGSSRSIVRRIASSLPIKPCPRVHFQLYPYTGDAGVLFGTRRQHGLVASLADVGWMDRHYADDEDYLDGPRPGSQAGLVFRAHQLYSQGKRLTRQRSLPSLYQGPPDPQGSSIVNDEDRQKIGALETELALLRAQVAQLLLAQEKSAQPAATTGAPPPPPCGTLPPPPPPPPPPPSLLRTFSAIELIKERKGKTVLEPKTAEIPNMLDILKDISNVKLRSVKSRDVKAKVSDAPDAVTLIAEALKRKFAHRYRNNSDQEEKADFKLPVSEKKSKSASPLFGQHMLKPSGKRV